MAYTSQLSDDMLLNQGVQHAYELAHFQVSIQQIESLKFNVFPNPTAHSVYITTDYSDHKTLTLSIYASDGQLISIEQLLSETTAIRMNNLANGNYLFFIRENGTQVKTFKIIKHL